MTILVSTLIQSKAKVGESFSATTTAGGTFSLDWFRDAGSEAPHGFVRLLVRLNV